MYTQYTNCSAVENAMKIVASSIANNPKIKVNYHNGSAVSANVEKGIINIPRIGHLDTETLEKLRTFIYHESGHILETKLPAGMTPKGALFMICNALEDCRIETVLSKQYPGCELTFKWASNYFNLFNGGLISKGEKVSALWEALIAMRFVYDGLTLAWTLNQKASELFQIGYPIFCKVKDARNTEDVLVLAKEMLKAIQENEEKGDGKDSKESKEKNEKDEKGNGKDSKKNKEKKEEKGDSKDSKESKEKNEKDKGEGSDSEDDGENSENDSENDGSGNDSDSEDDDNDSEDGDGADSNEDGADASGVDDELDSSSDKEGKDSDKDSDSTSESGQNNKGDSGDVETENTPQDDGCKSNSEHIFDIEEDAAQNTPDLLKQLQEQIQEKIKELKPYEGDYTFNRENDEFLTPQTNDNSKELYAERMNMISVQINGMRNALEQALRSLAACRKQGNLERGKVDLRKLTAIGKSLTKQVFYAVREGEKLNTAVSIVIDESGSMGGTYLEIQLLTMALGETLSKLGVPFEIVGATTKYDSYEAPTLNGFCRTNPIRFHLYKLFTENWGGVRERIVHTGAHSHHIDGEVVHFAASRLATRPEKRKIILSLSDGQPCGGQGQDDAIGRNLIDTCEHCRKNGIEVIGFGIRVQTPKLFYGEKYFVYLENVGNMGQDFFQSFATILTKGKMRI